MSRIRANKITNKIGSGAIELEKGAHIPVGLGLTGAGAINISGAITGGVITGSSFSGDGSGLIGVASTDNIITGTAATFNTMPVDINAGMTVAGVSTFGAITATSFGAVSGTTGTFSGNVSVGGVLTYEDVTNVDSVGVVTARSGIDCNGDIDVDGHTNLDNVSVAGVTTFSDNIISRNITPDTDSSRFLGSNGVRFSKVYADVYEGSGANLTGISVGITTEALTTAGATVTLDLSKDDHKITKSGTYTITCTGGSEASAHTLRIVNSGIATVGFSTYFLFPSGGTPNLPTANGAISLISFTVHRAGASGISTQLLGGASVNFS